MTGRVMWRTLSMVQVASASPRPRGRTAVSPAVVASVVLHALLLLLAARGREAGGHEALVAPAVPVDTSSDVWVGDTSLPGSGRLIDIDSQPGGPTGTTAGDTGAAAVVSPRTMPEAPAAASPAEPQVGAEKPVPAERSEPATSTEAPSTTPTAAPRTAPTAARAPSTAAPRATASSRPLAQPAARAPKPRPSADPGDALARALAGGSRAAARAVEDAHQHPDDGAAPGASAVPGAAAAGGGRFGAAGEAAAVRDLGRAFTRAIPPAVSNDPVWARLPAGSAGHLDVVVSIDASGHITGHRSRDGDRDRDAPKHLVKLVERTLALLESGTFALRGQVGAGTQALSLSVMLRDEAPQASDETRGLNLAFEYDGSRGKASFTQAGGRRVEVTIRVEQTTRAP